MMCLSRTLLITVSMVACWAQNFEPTVELTHGKAKGNVVKGKRQGEKERANLKDVQKFFPKVTDKEDGKDVVDGFTDSIADSLDDAQAELLVAGQKADKVCARDIKQFCGTEAMKSKHPLHCLGLLKDDQRSQIHKLCRVHIQESLTYTCAQDMDKLGCDPVMTSTIDCLTEGIDKLDQECLDQTRLVAKVVAKVNNAEVSVTTQENGKTVKKVHDGVYNDGNWQCPSNFMEHHTHGPCCYYMGDCTDRQKSNGIRAKFKCAKAQCTANQGKWVMKDEENMEMAGHLCCPSKKNGVQMYVDYQDPDEWEEFSRDSSSSGWWFFFIVIAALAYWQRNRVVHALNIAKQIALGDLNQVQIPLQAVELSTFVSGFFSGVKKHRDFVSSPTPQPEPQAAAAGGYGGL